MKPDYTNARSADGPTVYRWLAARIPIASAALKDDPLSYAARSWALKCGRARVRLVAIDALDRWLTPVGIHLSELPEDCWRWCPARVNRREQCEAVCSEWLDGVPARVLARRHGVNRATVAEWINDLRPFRDLAHGMEQGQQADGHGVPVPHPDRAGCNGHPATPPTPPSSPDPASVADLSEVAA